MIRIFSSFLVIFLMNERGSANFPNNFMNIDTAISWSDTVLEKGSSYYEVIKKSENPPTQLPLTEIFTKVDKISNEFETFLRIMNEKYAERFEMVTKNDEEKIFPYHHEPLRLSDLSNIVNHFYDNARSRNFKISRDKTLEEYFTQFVLIDSLSLPTALEIIHQSIVSSHRNRLFTEVALNDLDKMNQLRTCDKYISNQQSMLYIYINLLIMEMKGLSTLTYVYSLLQRANKATNYTIHLEIATNKFKNHMSNYLTRINKEIAYIPREIYRCDMNPPQRDVNFIEFVNYHRVLITSASTLGAEKPGEAFDFCDTDCEKIDHSFMESYLDQKIDNVQTVGYNDDVEICLFEGGSHRIYQWWNYQGQTFGHYETCPERTHLSNMVFLNMRPHCHTCQFSVIKTKVQRSHDILRISVSPQISDIENDMIVVGVKFVIHENAVHLKIQQGKYLPGEFINNSTVWKELDDNHQHGKGVELDYEMLADVSGQLYLDNVILPPKYAVTGVRFRSRKSNPIGFYLELHGTQLDLETGQLNRNRSDWFAAQKRRQEATLDYRRNRIEIKMTDPDNPSTCTGYNYDRATNKLIRFNHSSVIKDAGQSTVPYIDAQPVETYPSFPLNGIGLFYREKIGCGGYIAPRIFTFDISS